MDSQSIMRQKRIQEIRLRRERKRKQKLKRKITSIALTISIMSITLGGALNAAAKEVTITEINEFENTRQTKTIRTFQKNIQEVLDSQDIVLAEADTVNIPLDSSVEDNSELVVKRGKQITVKTNEGETVCVVTKANVMEALEEIGCEVGELDEVYPPRSANLNSDMDTDDMIEVVSVENKEEITIEPIAFETEYIEDDSILLGEADVVSEGEEGELWIIENVTYKNGVEIAREKTGEEIVKNPVNRIIANGTKVAREESVPEKADIKPMEDTEESGGSQASSQSTQDTINGYSYSKKIRMTATAYSTSPAENGGWSVSAMGNALRHGIVAVDPSIIPLGSTVYVEAADGSWVYGMASAEDTGTSIKGNRIDLCYEGSPAEVNMLGIRDCIVYVLD